MSQRGSAPRPTSRRASKSPSRDAKPSPSAKPGIYLRDEDAADSPQRSSGVSATAREDNAEHAAPRMIGVHNILNPSDTRSSMSGGRLPPPQHSESSSPSSSNFRGRLPGHEASPHATPAPVQEQQQNPPRFGTPTAVPAMSSGPPPFLDRGSPSLSHQYPGLGPGPRRILTPRSPRVASLSRALGRRSAEMQPSLPYPPPSALRSGASQADMFSVSGPPSQALPTFHPGSHLPVSTPGSTPPRSASQPVLANASPFGPAHDSSRDVGGSREQQERAPAFLSPSGFPPGFAPARSLGALGGPGGDMHWSSALMSSLQSGSGQRGMASSKAQHVLTIIPTSGEEIHVPVDVHQASRQADEKRLRNAGASARFRARKKMKEKETQGENQRLEAQNRELERELQEVRVERDFYRGERNRLRDIIYRTPSIRELVEHGPPSPQSARGGGLLSGPGRGGSLGGHVATEGGTGTPMLHQQAHQPPYTGNDPSLEPPSRRRRTDPAPEYTTPPYGPPPTLPNTLPPMPNPGYRAGPPSLSSSSPGNGRLPPLRLEQAMASPSSDQHPTPSAPPAILPPPQYAPYGRVPHETGWATAPPRGPHEGGPPR